MFYVEQGGKTTFMQKIPEIGSQEFNSRLEDFLEMY